MKTYRLLKDRYDQLQDPYLYQLYKTLITRYQTGGKLLEIGAFHATISKSVASLFRQVDAFDIDEIAIEKAKTTAPKNFRAFVHDMHEGLKERYDMIIAPIDVFNHAQDFSRFKAILKRWTNALNPKGIIMFDVLRCQYLSQLVGYQETLADDLVWSVEQTGEACTVKHIIKDDENTAHHIEKSYREDKIEALLTALTCLEKIVLEDRIIYVYKK